MTVKSKQELIDDINNEIVSNNTRKLTPEDLRRNLINIIDSIQIIPEDENLVSNNLSTPETRNTRVGIESLDSNMLSGQDNTAIGFHSLYSTYTGDYNTSIGSYSLGCNIYGDDNVSIGYKSLEANTQGSQNVAIGTHSLRNNKFGHNNIAIGAYAGYYIGENESFKFYLGSHNINSQYTCDHTDGSGLTPLLKGDLLNNILIINSNDINYDGKLQVNGNIVPSTRLLENDDPGNLGSLNYPWKKLFISEIWNSGNISIHNSIIPSGSIDIGTSGNAINNIYTNSLNVEGLATINSLHYNDVTNSQFVDKNVYLASSGTNPVYGSTNPYLTDEGIDGGGIIIQSSGISYRRNYSILYRQPNLDYSFATNAFEKASWESNISFVLLDGRFLRTSKIIHPDNIDIFKFDPSGYGISLSSTIIIGNSGDRNSASSWSNIGNFNQVFSNNYYSSNIYGTGSGLSIDRNIYSRYSGTLSGIYGFKEKYEDNLSGVASRYSINGYSNSSFKSIFIITRDTGLLGFSDVSSNFVPVTSLNIYTSGNSLFRNSSENGLSSIQLSVRGNVLNSGLEISHNNFSNKSTVSIYKDSIKNDLLILESGLSTFNTPISILENSGSVSYTTGYASLIIKPVSSPNKSQTIVLQDDQGRQFDLTTSSGNIFTDEFVYIDSKRNTLVGDLPYDTKEKIFASGGYENTSLGYQSVSGVLSGSGNIAIGYKSGDLIASGNNNILIGNKLTSTSSLSNTFLLGKDSGNILAYGFMGSSPFLGVESKLEISKKDNVEKVEIVQEQNDTIIRKKRLSGSIGDPEVALPINKIPGNEILGDKPTSSLYFDFVGNTTHRLLELNASGSLTSAYSFTNTKPYATLKGDLNIYGSLRFTDGTSISTGSGLSNSLNAGSGISISSLSGINTINLDVSKLSTSGSSITNDTNVITEISGVPKRTPVSQFSQFLNYENPQMFFPCSGGYNLVLSNNTAVYHSRHCNTIFVGEEAGDDANGFTNSIVIGTQAGQEAYFNNTYNLSVDIASIFLGYGAGRKSKNADNSIFIGPSAGQHSEGCDNSIFIGNSAGEFSRSEKSVAIGDNTLENVVGENNLEIVPNKEDFNRIINGTVSNKMNIGGIVAGDMCAGRVSVGGGARVFPSASLEVSANISDPSVPLLKLFNCSGLLVAYIDQEGNLVLSGNILTAQTLTESNTTPGTIPSGLDCGNGNFGGSTPPSSGDLGGGGSGDPGGSTPSGTAPSGYMLGFTSLFHEI